MTIEYLVGINIGGKHGSVTVEAEDALIAALKIKHEKLTSNSERLHLVKWLGLPFVKIQILMIGILQYT